MTKEMNKVVEFAHNLDLSKRLYEISENLKKETRDDYKKEMHKEIHNLAYQALVQNRSAFFKNSDEGDKILSGLTPEELAENPKYQELYKKALEYTQHIPLDRANHLLRNNLEDVLADIPKEELEAIAADPRFNDALDKDKLIKNYEELVEKAGKYISVKNLVRMYKENDGKFKGKDAKQSEAIEAAFYEAIAKSVGKKFEERLKNKGHSEESQEIGRSIAKLAAQAGLISDDLIKESADDALKKAEEEFREYERKSDKKLADYVGKGIRKLVNEKDSEKYGVALELVGGAANNFINDRKLKANDSDLYKLLAA